MRIAAFGCVSLIALAPVTFAESNEELAKKLSNPVAAMISIPLQGNYDHNIGPADDGERYYLNIQPVVPISLNEDWNLISRTILPVISQDDIFPWAGDQSGVGDVVQSFFFSPVAPTANGWIWGAGPVFLLDTASDPLLGSEKWGAGLTGVALKQDGPWTYGALTNHIESFAGSDKRDYVSATFIQPFLSYTTPDAWTFTVNSESTYDWNGEEWAVPVNLLATKLLRFGNTPVSIGGGARYWVDSTAGGPEGWGVRLVFTVLLPR